MGILGYMRATREYGVTYSPGMEQQFCEKFVRDGLDQPVELEKFNLFCDASGISVADEAYSIGGFTMTQYGTPIAWKSKKQSVRADSTCG